MRVQLRATVAADLPHCIDEPVPYRIQCVTATVDDGAGGERIIGLGGLGYKPDGTVICFAQFLPEAHRYPMAIHRAGRMMMDIIRRSGLPTVIAEAQPGKPAAWLERLGFVRTHAGGVEVFVWRRSE